MQLAVAQDYLELETSRHACHPWSGRLWLEVCGGDSVSSVPGGFEVALEDGPRHEHLVASRASHRLLLLSRLPNLKQDVVR